jgi:hypothetical protein
VKDESADVRTAAIRALADWPDATPLEDLLAVAKAAAEPLPRILALRGFVKLSAKATGRKGDAMAKLYAQAMGLAQRAEEKKALLSGLGGVRSADALAAAEACMKGPALKDEAALAVVKIAGMLWVTRPKEVKAALKRLSAAGVAPAVRAEAARILLELSKPVNLARDAKATSPDGLDSDGQASGDQAAIDGKAGTYWDEVNGRQLYRLVVTFPERRKIAVIRITGFQHHSYAPKDFEVLCDGKAVKAVRNAQYQDNRFTVAFAEADCTSVELKITGYYGASPAIRELEIFGPDPALLLEAGGHVAGAAQRRKGRLAVPLQAGRGRQAVLQPAGAHRRVRPDVAQPAGPPVAPRGVVLVEVPQRHQLLGGGPQDGPARRADRHQGRQLRLLAGPGRALRAEDQLPPAEEARGARREAAHRRQPAGCGRAVSRGLVGHLHGRRGRRGTQGRRARRRIRGLLGPAGQGHEGLEGRQQRGPPRPRDARQEGKVGGEIAPGKPACIAILDHPKNLRHPSPWYVAVRRKIPFHYFSPALLFSEPHTLKAGKSITLRYRLLVRPSLTDVKEMEAAWKAFAK